MTLLCEVARCPYEATTISSRVDAARDWTYRCDVHRVSEGVWEMSPLGRPAAELRELPQPQLSLELTLEAWPPKHRELTRRAARQIVEAGS